ncbi:phytanoyl-CoA dioxygenase family protein [Micromonospora sp. DH15]|nr:phytanoyl-CoA dioxygenase family protein [Micromonospora sp. DH15]
MSHQPSTAAATDLTDDQKRELDVNGWCVIPGLLTDEECDRFAEAVDEIWLSGDFSAYGEPGVRFVPMLLLYSALFEKCLNHPVVLAAARHMIGPELRVNLINGRHVYPRTGHQPLHDFDRPIGPPFNKCNVIWCLAEFTATNGSTRAIPGSHRDRTRLLATMTDPMAPHPDEQLVLAPRGAALLHNSHLIHAGTGNRSTAPRHSIHNAFTTPDVESPYDWTTVPAHVQQSLSPETLTLLGLR